MPCGNRTRLSSLEGWHLCRSAKGTCILRQAEAVGLEPTTDILPAPAFELFPATAARASFLPRRSAVGPCFQSDDFHFYQAAVAGIEPASRRLTVAFPYQHRTHRNRRMKAEERGMNSNRGQPLESTFTLPPSSFQKSAQSDLNRPNCPGRAARYRYIMGAKSSGQIVKDPGTSSGTGRT